MTIAAALLGKNGSEISNSNSMRAEAMARLQNPELLAQNQQKLKSQLGEWGARIMEHKLGSREQGPKLFSMSMVAAISPTCVAAAQMVKGTFDSTLFENFLY